MGIPDPAYSFTIPSVHDDTPLDCRIYHPWAQTNEQTTGVGHEQKRGAIVAHPYAPLGGTFDDHVVLAVAGQLLEDGFTVGTFNFRGAGTSKGRTSWAGKGELADYISFAGFFAHYLSMLDNPAYVTSLSEVQSSPVYLMPESATRRAFPQQDRSLVPTPEQLQLILGGYSYGSFVVTHLPAVNEILGRFSLPKEGTAEAEILLRARSLATQSNTELESFDRRSKWSRDTPSKRSHSVTIGGEESSPEVRRASREARRSGEGKLSFDIPRKIKSLRSRSVPASTNDTQSSLSDTMASAVSVSYLLISPLLPPISSALAPSLVFSASTTRSKEQRQLVEHPTLAVFGDKDGFTSVKKLRTWAQQLATQCDSRFQFEEIADAGHFWHEQDVQAELKEVVSRWAADITRMSAEA